MVMAEPTTMREHVAKLLDWEDAHPGFEAAVADLPPTCRASSRPVFPTHPGSCWSTFGLRSTTFWTSA